MFYRNPKKNPEKNKPTTVLGKRNVYRYCSRGGHLQVCCLSDIKKSKKWTDIFPKGSPWKQNNTFGERKIILVIFTNKIGELGPYCAN